MPRPTLTRVSLPGVLLSLLLQVLTPCSPAPAQQSSGSQQLSTANGINLYNQGKFDEAIKVLEKVVKKYDADADAWYYLGLAQYKSGLFMNSRPALERAVELQPGSADANAKLSYVLNLRMDSTRAKAAAKRAIELGDLSAEPHYVLAEVSLRDKDYRAALEETEKVLKIDSRFLPAFVTKSFAHYNLQQTSEAAGALEQLLALDPDNPDADAWRNQIEQIQTPANPWPHPDARQAIKPIDPNGPLLVSQVTVKMQVISKPEPQYTEAARRAGVSGTVLLQSVFGADGQVKSLFVRNATGYGLTNAAMNAAKQIKFTPAQKDGLPVSVYVSLEYNFNLY